MPPPASVVRALEQLLTAASGNTTVDAFAAFVVARGGDEEREWKAPADPGIPTERQFVESSISTIRQLLEASRNDYEIEGYESEEESEGEWNVLHVRFDTHEMEERRSFAFLPIGESFLLGDIDE